MTPQQREAMEAAARKLANDWYDNGSMCHHASFIAGYEAGYQRAFEQTGPGQRFVLAGGQVFSCETTARQCGYDTPDFIYVAEIPAPPSSGKGE